MSVSATSASLSALPAAGAPAATTGRARDPRIDATKAIAMLLVVFCHAKGVPHGMTLFAYSFHVPLFFLVSGWLASGYASHTAGRDRRSVGRHARSLLLPYVTFYLLGYAYWLLTRNIGEKAARWGSHPWWEPIVAMFTGIGPDLYVQPPLWFLPVMLVTVVSYFVLRRWISPVLIAVLALLLAWFWMAWFPAQHLRIFFGLDVLPLSLCFYALGALLIYLSPHLPTSLAGSAVATVVLALAVAWLANANGRIDVNMLEFGHNHALFLLTALLGSLMVICAARLVQGWAWLQWIGRNTLLILCTHMLVFFVLSGVAALAGGFGSARPGLAWAVFVTLFALAACVPMRWVLMRFAPWTLGARRVAA
ncbi:acyltransferase family protein [Xanthomonas nasturtii]|uniref:Acyltransferase family protein n=1 Tax=Xanthomonas nasturtii TaxID=1843581 RepID=A0A3E1KL91_9XANT|nr:acyltransferase family protein [Xanthomonas nasturtii]MCL1500406.1 acyltransferase family protein [Xanthomonas nasturtii]MCL1504164.1 acyltransferase family protein [Xanthomonas nasturtii]MCL1523385.1 acyltransferase family protein [Xanthomonas nasturtii]MCL1526168.1 acyltransferase family protein [Xanthomonas nasturtii]MCL1529710.1 acyltransferase family protein [Xanthomonas nasturtii]